MIKKDKLAFTAILLHYLGVPGFEHLHARDEFHLLLEDHLKNAPYAMAAILGEAVDGATPPPPERMERRQRYFEQTGIALGFMAVPQPDGFMVTVRRGRLQLPDIDLVSSETGDFLRAVRTTG